MSIDKLKPTDPNSINPESTNPKSANPKTANPKPTTPSPPTALGYLSNLCKRSSSESVSTSHRLPIRHYKNHPSPAVHSAIGLVDHTPPEDHALHRRLLNTSKLIWWISGPTDAKTKPSNHHDKPRARNEGILGAGGFLFDLCLNCPGSCSLSDGTSTVVHQSPLWAFRRRPRPLAL